MTVRFDDVVMEYFSFGKGARACVIVPGLSIQSILLFEEAVAARYHNMAEDYTVYVFSPRNDLPAGFTIRQMAHDLARAVTALGIGPVDLFGASMGGMIAQSMAIDHPHLVRSLALASTFSEANPITTIALQEWLEDAARRDIEALSRSTLQLLYGEEFCQSVGDALTLPPGDVTEEEFVRFEICARAVLSFNAKAQLGKIRCPTLVVCARHDRVVPWQAASQIAEILGCEIVVYEQYGHAVYDEAADFPDRVKNFFDRAG